MQEKVTIMKNLKKLKPHNLGISISNDMTAKQRAEGKALHEEAKLKKKTELGDRLTLKKVD